MLAIYNKDDLQNINTWDLSRENKTPKDIGIEPMLETPVNIEMGQVLIIEDVAYGVVSMARGGRIQPYAVVAKLRLQDIFAEGDTANSIYDSVELKCPFCGTVCEDTHEMNAHEDKYTCCMCNSTFAYQQQIQITYDIIPLERGEVKTFSHKEEASCS